MKKEESPNSIIPNENLEEKKYWEGRQNLFGFFQLLLEVDKRTNPHLYKKKKIKEPKEND